ncbi:MAG: nuclear transport factor 2 family protein [Mucilaginibacter sp.]|uniref:YybH family protein n=1 Tax=Mucilaginibacter sp. TaxID=1882438 RepID=UPI003264549D
MKKLIFLFCLLILVSCISLKAQNKQAILKVLETQRIAWNNGDIPAFMQGYWKSDSLMFVGKSGPTYGWQQTLEHYKKGYPDKATMGVLSFKILKVDILDPSNAFVLGGWNLKREKDAPGGYFTLWFRKIKGVWVIVCDHTS